MIESEASTEVEEMSTDRTDKRKRKQRPVKGKVVLKERLRKCPVISGK